MPKNFNNAVIVKRILVTVFVLALAGAQLHAQQDESTYRKYISDIKVVINNKMLGYKYKLTMYNTEKKNAADYMQGIILKNGSSYLDSNKVGVTLSADGYVFKAVNSEKTANIIKNSSMESKLGVKTTQMNNEIFTIPDSLLFKVGKFTLEQTQQAIVIKYNLNDKTATMQQFNFTLRKSDNRILSISIINQAGGGYRRELNLFDFENSFDNARLSSSRYFRVVGGKAVLQPPYNTFKINALL